MVRVLTSQLRKQQMAWHAPQMVEHRELRACLTELDWPTCTSKLHESSNNEAWNRKMHWPTFHICTGMTEEFHSSPFQNHHRKVLATKHICSLSVWLCAIVYHHVPKHTCLMCSVMPDVFTRDWKKCSTNCVSYVPILSVGISRLQLKWGRPDRSWWAPGMTARRQPKSKPLTQFSVAKCDGSNLNAILWSQEPRWRRLTTTRILWCDHLA